MRRRWRSRWNPKRNSSLLLPFTSKPSKNEFRIEWIQKIHANV
jgi:hypothetical protein